MQQYNPLLSNMQAILDQDPTTLQLTEKPPKPDNNTIIEHKEQRRKAMEALMQRSKLNAPPEWKWTLSQKIGQSNFSVFREERNPVNRSGVWAVKRIEKDRAGFGKPTDWILREISSSALLTQEKSAHFVEFFGWTEDSLNVYIAMEFIEQGDLDKYLKADKNRWSEDDIRAIAKQLLCGLDMMHDHHIIHRDLKPANIFLVTRNPVYIKIGDFGVSKRVSTHGESTTAGITDVGSSLYRAPETWGGDPYDFAVDLWSLGCILYRVAMGVDLYKRVDPRKWEDTWIRKQLELIGPEILTPGGGVDVMARLICVEPELRIAAKEALKHPWIINSVADREVGDAEKVVEAVSEKEGEMINDLELLNQLAKNMEVSNEAWVSLTPRAPGIDNGRPAVGQINIDLEKVNELAENHQDAKTEMVQRRDSEDESTENIAKTIPVSDQGGEVMIDYTVVSNLARDKEHGKEGMMLLLDRKGENIKTTPTAVESIFEMFDKDVATRLVEKIGKNIDINWTVVKAVSNMKGGKEVIMLLLNGKPGDIKITSTAVESIFQMFDKDVAARLISKIGRDIMINWSIVNALAKREDGKEVMMLLLNRTSEDINITPTAVETIFQMFDKDVITFLVHQRPVEITINWSMVNSLTTKEGGKELMKFLYDRKGDFEMTSTAEETLSEYFKI